MPPEVEIHQSMLIGLQAWMLISVTAGLIGLYRRHGEMDGGFWLMTGLWGVVDGLIAWWNLNSPPASLTSLSTTLLVNLFLNVGYIILGVVLAGRHSPLLRGFGWAIIVQGVFLFLFDLHFYRLCWQ